MDGQTYPEKMQIARGGGESLKEGAGEMDQLVNLLCKPEDMSSNPQHSYKKLGAHLRVLRWQRQEAL